VELWHAHVRDAHRSGTFNIFATVKLGLQLIIRPRLSNTIQPPFYCDDVQVMYSKIMNEKLNPPKRIGEV
jgi:hypothetical protein